MLVGEQNFNSRGRCTIALTGMHSDLRSNPSAGPCINLYYLYMDPLFCILGCNNTLGMCKDYQTRLASNCHLYFSCVGADNTKLALHGRR